MTSQTPQHRTAAEYVAAQRHRATTEGHPVLRMGHPAIASLHGRYVVVASRDKTLNVAEFTHDTEVGRWHGAEAVTVLGEKFHSLHWSGERPRPDGAPSVFVFADHATITLVSRLLADVAKVKNGRDRMFAASKRLAFRATQQAGHRVVILTDALADRFYPPTNVNPKRIGSWADAFGVSADAEGLARMARMAADGDCVDGYLLSHLDNLERNFLSTSAYSSIQWACKTMEYAAKAIDVAETVHALDPYLSELNTLTGVTTSVTYEGHGNGVHRVGINGNCNFKEGEAVWVANGFGGLYAFTVERLYLYNDSLKADLAESVSSFRSVGRGAVLHSRPGAGLTVLTAPFIFSTKPKGHRTWSPYEKHEPVKGRSVPVSVAIAGARTE